MMSFYVCLIEMLMELFTTIGCFMAIATAGIIIGSPIMIIILFADKCEREGGLKACLKKLINKLRNREVV